MPYSVNQIARKLAREYGVNETDADYIAQIEEWINESYADLLQTTRFDWSINSEESVTTVVGTAEYSLTATVLEATSARITTTDQEVVFEYIENLIARGVDMEQQATPRYYYASGYDETNGKHKIKFWPVPSAVLTIKFSNYKQARMLASATVIPIPDYMLTVLKNRTRFYMSMDDNAPEDADRYLRMFSLQLAERRHRQNTPVAAKRTRAVQDVGARTRAMPDAGSKYEYPW